MTNSQTSWQDWTKSTKASDLEKVRAELEQIKKWQRTHLGTDFVASGIDYPHPNQKVKALYTAGAMRQNETGIQFLFDYTSIYGPGIFWFNEYVDNPNSIHNPSAFINIVNLSDQIRMQHNVVSPAGSQSATIQLMANDTAPQSRIYLAANTAVLGVTDDGIVTNVYITNAPLTLANATSDYTVTDGALWYRSDIDRFRARANGVTENLAYESDIPVVPTLPPSNKVPFVSKSANYTTTADDGFISVDASGAGRTITLVTAVGNAGLRQTVKKIDASANVVRVDPGSGQTIDGAGEWDMAVQWNSVTFVSDGANWLIESYIL